ncbi:hypothetical protein [Pseudoalteromonas sp. MelDa3]|uniref:hypothetical protein n=1 Tax=Pseudoalteromonas sp. MelDa3 TaxID=888435 RepID=UPI000CB801FE|nr:hypothetical protein [Pseudoalteromonas sp. MelDa3]PLT26705.1 hypothetical protein CXF89_03885 [Pseudoalteromonas sp. MelDa3]
MTIKKSTLTQLSPVGEVFCDGFIANTKPQAVKIIKDGAQVNHDAVFANFTKTVAVLAEKNCLTNELRDSLLATGAYILVQAQKKAVAAQESEIKAEPAKKADKAA